MDSFSEQKIKGLRLDGNWQGLAVAKWSDFAFKPAQLLEEPDFVFKSDGLNTTVLKKIEMEKEKFSFVVKKTASYNRLKNLTLMLRVPKAVRNLHVAIGLKNKKIEVAEPVAALWRKRGLGYLENVYITEFCRGSLNLYDIAFGRNKEINTNFSVRKSVIKQIAGLVAKLHKAGFWHRDSKAGNFVVYENNDGSYGVKLVDLDGIKLNLFNRTKKRVRTLSKLAETLTRFRTVNFTDLYRGFCFYCDDMGIGETEAKKLFGRVERATVAARLFTMVSDSYKLQT